MRTMFKFVGRAFVVLLAATFTVEAADKAKPEPKAGVPNQREIWVPSNQLAKVLAQHPNAVVLSREQYETLLRDAKVDHKSKPVAPRRVSLTAARYQARLVGKVVQVLGTLSVNVLSDEWSQLSLPFYGVSIGTVQVDGDAAFEPKPIAAGKGAKETLTVLLLRGRGERTVTVEFTLPVSFEAGVSRVNGTLPAAAASALQMTLPAGQRVESAQPIRVTNTAEATSVDAGFSPANPTFDLSWRSAGGGAKALEPLVSANGVYTIDAERLRVDYGFAVETQLGNLAETYELALPGNGNVLQVTGDEVAKWEVAAGKLRITFQPGERSTAKFWIVLETPSLANAASATLPLFVPRIEGLSRLQGVFSLVGDAGVIVKAVATDASVQPTERAIDPTPYFVASYQFNAAPTAPSVTVEKVQTRFSADLDTLVEFKPEAVFIERTLTLHQEKGETFQVSVALPAGEEVMTVRTCAQNGTGRAEAPNAAGPAAQGQIPYAKVVPDKPGFVVSPHDGANGYIDVRGFPPGTEVKDPFSGKSFLVPPSAPNGPQVANVAPADVAPAVAETEPDWRMENGKLRIRWSERTAGQDPSFKIRTRVEPANWSQLNLDGQNFTVNDAQVEGAEKITGYIALTADESFRLEAAPSETLERRDGRTTPVRGDYAWFRRQDFTLTVKVAKRPGEVLAALIGYALPLEGVLDLHAQINFQFLHSGTRSVRIQVPEKLAGNFYFEGSQIAERNLNGDTWTIVFQKELTGNYALSMTAQIPVEKGAGATNDESRFQAAVPLIVPLDVVRTSGVWAVEANTETEIQFEAKGMNELDSLLAPQLPEYQPRHRVIGVFAWLGKEYSLALSGVRHAPASMLTSVVDQLDLDTVVSTSGVERNQATFQLRTAGAQYLDVQLPAKSRLLSLTVDDAAVKPVGDRPDQVRVQLPAKQDASRAAVISVFYETAKGEWNGTGDYATRAPKLAKEIPVLRSIWRLYLPEGFEYTSLKSNLRAPSPDSERPLIFSPLALYREWRARRGDEVAATWDPGYERRAQDAIQNGDSAIAAKQYEEATVLYKAACDLLRDASNLRPLYKDALERFGAASCLLAEQQITEGKYAEAQATLRTALDARYVPTMKRAIILLARLEQPDYYNKTIGPEFRATVEKVKQWYVEAQGFFDTGRFDMAKKRCEQILEVDKYNIAARTLSEKIDRKISDYGAAAYNEARAQAIKEVDLAWQRPIRRFNTAEAIPLTSEPRESNLTEHIRRKLETIIIPKLELREATLREAIEFLKKKSQELDVNSPQGERGVNIVMKLGDEPGSAAEARITVSLSNIPLIEALRYVTGLANTKFKVEPYAISVVQLTEPTDVLITKEWKLPPNLIPGMPAAGATPSPGSGIADRESSKNWLTANGVTFNGSASAVYIVRSNRLIVRNTQDQLDLIDSIIGNTAPEPPQSNVLQPRESNLTERMRRKLETIVIPKLEFREVTVREAVDFLKKKSQELDANSPLGDKGVNIILKLEQSAPAAPQAAPPGIPGIPGLVPVPPSTNPPAGPAAFGNPADARITVTLTNIPLIEALRYVSGLANLKLKVDTYAVSIVPLSEATDVLVTKQFKFPVGLIPLPAGVAESGAADREGAKNWLIANGIEFNGAAWAVYMPRTGRLIIRNTQEQIDLIDTIISTGATGAAPQPAAGGKPAGVAGLIPMKIELPKTGRVIQLDGLAAADEIKFRFDDWWNRARRLWMWFVAGGLLALFFAGSRPWWRTCWAVVILTFYPYCVSVEATPICNALLAGWLLSVVLQRLAVRFVFVSSPQGVRV